MRPRHKAILATALSIVRSADEAHELRHDIAVVPRRAERVFRDQPARREDDKIDVREPWRS